MAQVRSRNLIEVCNIDELQIATSFFRDFASKVDIPGYFDVIKKPMCWKVIDEKLDKNMYARLKDTRYTLFLILVIISVIISRISASIRKISILFSKLL